jgi:hypothetical protein
MPLWKSRKCKSCPPPYNNPSDTNRRCRRMRRSSWRIQLQHAFIPSEAYQARPRSTVSATFCLTFPQVLVPGGRTVPRVRCDLAEHFPESTYRDRRSSREVASHPPSGRT